MGNPNISKSYKCDFCGSTDFERWNGKGLSGLRCSNKCLASYVIFTEPSFASGFPQETDEEKKQRIRDEEIHKKRRKKR